jgi:intracellular sulfur oxidation DsrE/DsrF family protein
MSVAIRSVRWDTSIRTLGLPGVLVTWLVGLIVPIVVAETSAEGASSSSQPPQSEALRPTYVTPFIDGYGSIVSMPRNAEQPKSGSQVVFDISGSGGPEEVVKGLNGIATFLNLAVDAGITPESLRLVAVLHGSATRAVLRREVYAEAMKTSHNPNLDLIRKLKAAGVELYVCGQALAHQRHGLNDVDPEITVAVSATTVLVNKQMNGYAYLPYH